MDTHRNSLVKTNASASDAKLFDDEFNANNTKNGSKNVAQSLQSAAVNQLQPIQNDSVSTSSDSVNINSQNKQVLNFHPFGRCKTCEGALRLVPCDNPSTCPIGEHIQKKCDVANCQCQQVFAQLAMPPKDTFALCDKCISESLQSAKLDANTISTSVDSDQSGDEKDDNESLGDENTNTEVAKLIVDERVKKKKIDQRRKNKVSGVYHACFSNKCPVVIRIDAYPDEVKNLKFPTSRFSQVREHLASKTHGIGKSKSKKPSNSIQLVPTSSNPPISNSDSQASSVIAPLGVSYPILSQTPTSNPHSSTSNPGSNSFAMEYDEQMGPTKLVAQDNSKNNEIPSPEASEVKYVNEQVERDDKAEQEKKIIKLFVDGRNSLIDDQFIHLNIFEESFIFKNVVKNATNAICINGVENVEEFVGLLVSAWKMLQGKLLQKKLQISMIRGLVLNIHAIQEDSNQLTASAIDENFVVSLKAHLMNIYSTQRVVFALIFSSEKFLPKTDPEQNPLSSSPSFVLAKDQPNLVDWLANQLCTNKSSSELIETSKENRQKGNNSNDFEAVDEKALGFRLLNLYEKVGLCNGGTQVAFFFETTYPGISEILKNMGGGKVKTFTSNPSIRFQKSSGDVESQEIQVEKISIFSSLDFLYDLSSTNRNPSSSLSIAPSASSSSVSFVKREDSPKLSPTPEMSPIKRSLLSSNSTAGFGQVDMNKNKQTISLKWHIWGNLSEKINPDENLMKTNDFGEKILSQRIGVNFHNVFNTYESLLDTAWRDGVISSTTAFLQATGSASTLSSSPSASSIMATSKSEGFGSLTLVKEFKFDTIKRSANQAVETIPSKTNDIMTLPGNTPSENQESDISLPTQAIFSKDGTKLYAIGTDGFCRIWNVQDEVLLGTLDHGCKASLFSLSPKEDKMLISGQRRVTLWNLDSMTLLKHWNYENLGVSIDIPIAFSDSGLLIVLGSQNEKFQTVTYFEVFEVNSLKSARVFKNHVNRVTSIKSLPIPDTHDKSIKSSSKEGNSSDSKTPTWSKNSQLMISCSEDFTARLWDAATTIQYSIFSVHTGAIFDLDISKDSNWLLTASYDRTVVLWNVLSNKVAKVLRHKNMVKKVMFTNNGKCCVSTTSEGVSSLWSLFDDDEETDSSKSPTEHPAKILFTIYPSNGAMVSPDGLSIISYMSARKWMPVPNALTSLKPQSGVSSASPLMVPSVFMYKFSSFLFPFFRSSSNVIEPIIDMENEDKVALPYIDAAAILPRLKKAIMINNGDTLLFNLAAWYSNSLKLRLEERKNYVISKVLDLLSFPNFGEGMDENNGLYHNLTFSEIIRAVRNKIIETLALIEKKESEVGNKIPNDPLMYKNFIEAGKIRDQARKKYVTLVNKLSLEKVRKELQEVLEYGTFEIEELARARKMKENLKRRFEESFSSSSSSSSRSSHFNTLQKDLQVNHYLLTTRSILMSKFCNLQETIKALYQRITDSNGMGGSGLINASTPSSNTMEIDSTDISQKRSMPLLSRMAVKELEERVEEAHKKYSEPFYHVVIHDVDEFFDSYQNFLEQCNELLEMCKESFNAGNSERDIFFIKFLAEGDKRDLNMHRLKLERSERIRAKWNRRKAIGDLIKNEKASKMQAEIELARCKSDEISLDDSVPNDLEMTKFLVNEKTASSQKKIKGYEKETEMLNQEIDSLCKDDNEMELEGGGADDTWIYPDLSYTFRFQARKEETREFPGAYKSMDAESTSRKVPPPTKGIKIKQRVDQVSPVELTSEDIETHESFDVNYSGGISKVYFKGELASFKQLHLTRSNASPEAHGAILALFSISHPNVASIKSYTLDPNFVAKNSVPIGAGIVFEDCKRGSLRSFIQRLFEEGKLQSNQELLRKILLRVSMGMHYLHTKLPYPIIHGELATDAVYLEEDFEAKIIGAGLAQLIESNDFEHDHINQSSLKRQRNSAIASSSSSSKRSTKASDTRSLMYEDIYNFGLIIYEVITGKQYWEGLGSGNFVQSLRKLKTVPESSNDTQDLVSLMENCLDRDVSNRPNSFGEIVEYLKKQVPPTILYELEPTSDEFKKCELLFFPQELEKQGTLTRDKFVISKITRIYNDLTDRLYHAEVKNIQQDLLSAPYQLPNGVNANEKLLFHGTRGANPYTIAKSRYGLMKEYGSEGFYGRGIYFAELARYTHQGYVHRTYFKSAKNASQPAITVQVTTGSGVQKTVSSGANLIGLKSLPMQNEKREPAYKLLVCSVVCGNQLNLEKRVDRTLGQKTLPEKHHSVRAGPHLPNQQGDGSNDSTLHIIYKDSQCTPKYVIEYDDTF